MKYWLTLARRYSNSIRLSLNYTQHVHAYRVYGYVWYQIHYTEPINEWHVAWALHSDLALAIDKCICIPRSSSFGQQYIFQGSHPVIITQDILCSDPPTPNIWVHFEESVGSV